MPKGGSRRRVNGSRRRGYLRDITALEWGKFNVPLEERTHVAQHNRDVCEGEGENANEQIAIATPRSNEGKSTGMLGKAAPQTRVVHFIFSATAFIRRCSRSATSATKTSPCLSHGDAASQR